jgi:hypothetical protein
MNTKNIVNGRFSLVSSAWLLALALGASVTACGAAPDGQGGESLESTAASADQQDSDAGPAEPASDGVDPLGPLAPVRPGSGPVRLGGGHHPYSDQDPGAR